MPVKEIGDPRLQRLFGTSDPSDGGVRPMLRLPRKGLPPIVIAAAMLLVAVLLFSLLNWRRTAQTEPTAQPLDGQTKALVLFRRERTRRGEGHEVRIELCMSHDVIP